MIISASRRTDIPAFFSEWFINRIRAGWCLVPNPMNYGQQSYVSLRPDDVDAIVFWSKNPAPLLRHLDELDSRGYHYYFQFSLNDYPKALEPNVPNLDRRIEVFRSLGDRLGPRRVVWRYDPIVISNQTPPDFHRAVFEAVASRLSGYTKRVMVSLVDYYRKTERRLSGLEKEGLAFERGAADSPYVWKLLNDLAAIAKANGMDIFTCAEEHDFTEARIPPGRCVDGDLLRELWHLEGHNVKDPSQRPACLCVVSKDIGMNDTCLHGCAYCYSTRSPALASRRHSEHDPESPVLWGKPRTLSEDECARHSQARLL